MLAIVSPSGTAKTAQSVATSPTPFSSGMSTVQPGMPADQVELITGLISPPSLLNATRLGIMLSFGSPSYVSHSCSAEAYHGV